MEFERLKKSHKKEIIIGTLAVCAIGGVLTFATTRAKYKVTESIKLVDGTINYKPYDFKVMAMYKSEDGTSYTEINEMPSSGYIINEEKTYCTTDNKTQVKGKIKTIDGNVAISNLSKSDKCYLYFDKEKTAENISELIANATKGSGTPTFSNVAISNEGVYAASDGMYGGTSYYWRGAVTDNYVKFANFCWRIVRINGDGSMRLIYDGSTCHANGTNTAESIAKNSIAYNTSHDQSNYVGWTYTGTSQRTTSGTASNAKTQLESWYSSNITGTNTTKVADGKFCNDRNVQSGSTWAIAPSSKIYYAGYKRLKTDYTPTLSCSNGDIYSLKVGLITADEVAYAGAVYGTENNLYYLYNGQSYWTMSPGIWDTQACMFRVDSFGSFSGNHLLSNNIPGLRPVINLRSDITFSSGNGTLDSPYVVS